MQLRTLLLGVFYTSKPYDGLQAFLGAFRGEVELDGEQVCLAEGGYSSP